MRKPVLKFLGWGAVVIGGMVGAALSYRSILQRQNAAALEIRSPNGINVAEFVKLGGVEQWVQVRGEDVNNPVLLLLHGGPGMSYVPFTPFFKAWEKHFTVVLWDRRGVGKTLARSGEAGSGAITFESLASDGVELSEHLKLRLRKPKIVLVGHSVGSVVGILMAHRRPDLFAAYVGTDQIVDGAQNESVSYSLLVERVRDGGDAKLIKAVSAVGPPPYTDANRWFEKQRLVSATDPVVKSFENSLFPLIMTAPNYSMKDMMAVGQGLKFSAAALLAEMMTIDLRKLGLTFNTPVFFILGENDVLDPTRLAVEYFGTLQAPQKELVLLKGSGHNVMLITPEAFLAELLTRVRPLATQ